MNTERTEKFVNAIACDLEEGGFRQVSGTTLRRTLATAVSAALPLLADVGIPASQPAELAEQQGVELPPLPASRGFIQWHSPQAINQAHGFTANQMQDYARAAFAAGANAASTGAVLVNMGDSEAEFIRMGNDESALAAIGKQQVGEVQLGALLAEMLEDSARAAELANRLIAPGPKAAQVSASETHEISDFVLTVVDLLPVLAARQPGAANGKLVGWWNGITPGYDGQGDWSIRWGADAENSRHDIPLYDGFNPIHYQQPAQGVDPVHVEVIESLLQVAYAAFTLADDTEDDGDSLTVTRSDFYALSAALDRLDELPDDQPSYVMECAAKARWALRGLIDQRDAAPGPRISQGTHDPSGVANG